MNFEYFHNFQNTESDCNAKMEPKKIAKRQMTAVSTKMDKPEYMTNLEIREMVDEYYTETIKQKGDKFFYNKLDADKKRNFLICYQLFISNHYIDSMKG